MHYPKNYISNILNYDKYNLRILEVYGYQLGYARVKYLLDKAVAYCLIKGL